MKNFVIRILAPQIPVFDFSIGSIDPAQGQFVPDSDIETTLTNSYPAISDLVRYDTLLGGKSFVTSDNLGFVVRALTADDRFIGMEFYPNFMVLKLNDDGTKEKEVSR